MTAFLARPGMLKRGFCVADRKRVGGFLCRTEFDRARVVEASGRVRVARAVCAATLGVALVLLAPWVGWWTLILFGLVAVNLITLERRLQASARPEGVAARAVCFTLLVIGAGVAVDGGVSSPALPWLVIPGAMAATRFRWQVVLAFAALTTAVALLVTVPVDPAAVASNPSPLIVTCALIICVNVITSALMHGELIHRDRAVLDSLTGLLNRSALEHRVIEVEQQARLTGGAVSLVVCDIDRFKFINDTYGHERGDTVLRDIAYEMRKSLRSFELLYRIGGEEFLILLPGVGEREASEVAERLRRATAAARPGGLALTVSAGVASARGSEVTYEPLFRAADEALLAAKRQGRNRVVAAQPAPEAAPAEPGPRSRQKPLEPTEV